MVRLRLSPTLALAVAGLFLVAAPAGAAPLGLPALHVERGSSPAIVDSRGRQVLLRGVNVNQLGDYYRVDPSLPSTVPLTEGDFTQISGLGMDVVRLIVHWSKLEPQRGSFDRAYLDRIREAVGWAHRHGIYVVLDMHQDAWGKYIATPPDERCAPGFSPNQGWDGAPSWATITDGLPSCRLGVREVSPAVGDAFQSLWDDRDGIQGELVRTWARLARAFAADPTVAGYDLINEPNPGLAPGATDATLLGRYYARAIDAIRAAERRAAGGFHHIAFFEPGVIWSGAGFDLTPPPGFTADRNVVFAPHLYAGSITLDRAILGTSLVSIDRGFDLARLAAAPYGTPVWSGEWGWFGDPGADEAKIAEYARQEDAHLWGGAWWQWRQACGDPHNFSDGRDTAPSAVSGNLNPLECPAGTALPQPSSTIRILSRAYPRAAPGRLTSLRSDPQTGEIRIAGTDPDRTGSDMLRLWVPGSATPPRFAGSGIHGVTARPYAGGWLVSARVSGDYALHRVG